MLVKCSLFLFYFVHLLIENIIQLHLFDNQKDVRKTREEIWCQGRKNDCDSPWLMIVTCNCDEWCNYRTCETQKSQSDYFTTTCISMKSIHWKCALTWWQKSFHRSDSLKWLSWIRAVHIPSFLQWLNESIRSRKKNTLIRQDLWSLFVSCRTWKDSKHILNDKQAENSVSAFRKCCTRPNMSRQIISFILCERRTISCEQIEWIMIWSLTCNSSMTATTCMMYNSWYPRHASSCFALW